MNASTIIWIVVAIVVVLIIVGIIIAVSRKAAAKKREHQREQAAQIRQEAAESEHDVRAREAEVEKQRAEAKRAKADADARAAEAGATGPVAAFYPSLHLNLGEDHRKLGDLDAARHHLELGRATAGALADDGYGQMVRGGLDALADRLGPASPP